MTDFTHVLGPRTASAGDRRYRIARFVAIAYGVVFSAGSPARAGIEVNVTRVGFPTICHGHGHVVRNGQWTPIIVDLDLLGQSAFDGAVRASQLDLDGDQCFDSLELHLHTDTGGSTRRILYVLANTGHGDGRFTVELFGGEGETVEVVSQGELTYKPRPAQQPVVLSDDEKLILSLSTGAVGRVRELVDSNEPIVFDPPVHVAHISPAELPGLWIGLEAVDYVVWDEARPEDLTERQRQALVHWVEFGGTLLVAGARTAGSIQQDAAISRILPVEPGPAVAVMNLPEVRRLLSGPPPGEATGRMRRSGADIDPEWYESPWAEPVLVVPGVLKPGALVLAADALPTSSEPDAPLVDATIVAEHRVGLGRVIYSGVALKDLLSGPDHAPDFFAKLFYLTRLTADAPTQPHPLPVFNSIVSAVAFSTSSSVYLFAAFLFSAAYVLAATGGTWWFLGRRGWRRHSWSAFALVALAATFLSLVAVGWMRGIGEHVQQLSVIDFREGDGFATATTYFGLKTATDKELDLWLPSDPVTASEPTATACVLKPLLPSDEVGDTRLSFADPEAYQVVPASAVIDDVRIRSTLKRFEGRWRGPIKGTVRGGIDIHNDLFSDESHVTNELEVDLYNCYLLHARLDPFDAKRGRLAPAPRDSAIYAYPIGRVAAGERVELAPLCNPKPDPQRGGAPTPPPTLESRHKQWARPLWRTFDFGFGASGDAGIVLGQEQNALLIASTSGEFDPASLEGVVVRYGGQYIPSHDRLRQLDLRGELTRDTAILVGFAAAAGPVRLFRRTGDRPYRMLEPNPRKSSTMYRIRIPVTFGMDEATTLSDGEGGG